MSKNDVCGVLRSKGSKVDETKGEINSNNSTTVLRATWRSNNNSARKKTEGIEKIVQADSVKKIQVKRKLEYRLMKYTKTNL